MTLTAELVSEAPRATGMRRADKDECWAGGLAPHEAISRSLALSQEAWAIRDGAGAILAVWGLAKAEGKAQLWMLSYESIEAVPVSAAKESLRTVRRLQVKYPILEVLVHARYALSIRWLQWLGFRFVGASILGVDEVFFTMQRRA